MLLLTLIAKVHTRLCYVLVVSSRGRWLYDVWYLKYVPCLWKQLVNINNNAVTEWHNFSLLCNDFGNRTGWTEPTWLTDISSVITRHYNITSIYAVYIIVHVMILEGKEATFKLVCISSVIRKSIITLQLTSLLLAVVFWFYK